MSPNLHSWIETQLWPWLGDIAWQSTAVLAMVLATVWCLRHRSAARRHTVLALGMCSVALLLALSFVMPFWSLRTKGASDQVQELTNILGPSPHPTAKASTLSPPTNAQNRSTKTAPSSAFITAAAVHQSGIDFSTIVALLWLAGIVAGSALLALSAVGLRKLRLRAEPATHPALLSILDAARRDTSIPASSVRLCIGDSGIMPMMWGWRRISILLPREAEGWSRERLDFVLRHELAHAVRWDAPISLACWIVMLPLWWHPLAWLALRLLSRLREEACDEQVLHRLDRDRREDYAVTLVHVIAGAVAAPRRMWLPALAMASARARALRKRLEAIVDETRDQRPFTSRGKVCALGSAALLAVGLSMLSACREAASSTVTNVPAADGSRTYYLTDKQWESLTKPSDSERRAPSPPVDPFSTVSATPAVKEESPTETRHESLSRLALRIRTHLLEAGVNFTTAPDEEVVVLKNERTMRVWTDDAGHERITSMLAREGKKPLVQIVCHAFSVPLRSDWIQSLTGNLAPAHPNVAQISAVFNPAQADDLLRRIKGDKDCNLFAAPTVVTPDGQRAVVENIREMIYPTEFDPPQIPQQAMGPSGFVDQAGAFPVTPTTPTAFEMRPVGFRCEIEPTVSGDMRTIELTLAPEWTVFEGFINYGQPIYSHAKDALGKVVPVELTPNRIQQPVFRNNKVSTSVTILDGACIVIGGLGEPPGADISKPTASGMPVRQDVLAEGETPPLITTAVTGTQGDSHGDLNIKNLPPISKVDRAIFYLFQAKIVDTAK